MLLDPEVKQAARERWGEAVFDEHGGIDRSAVAQRVFAADGSQELKFWEGEIHPRVRRRLQEKLETLRQGDCPAAVLDVPLLLESGWDRMCDKILFVETPLEQRLQRAAGRGWSREEYEARQSRQLDLEEKRRRADVVMDNSGTEEQTRRRVEEVWRGWFITRKKSH